MMDEWDIQRYVQASYEIKRLQIRKNDCEQSIYNHNLYTHLEYDENVHVKAPKVDQLIEDEIMTCLLLDDQIKRWQKRAWYFQRYLGMLTPAERYSLRHNTINDDLKAKTLDELYEIESAIAFQFDYEQPDKRLALTNDSAQNVAQLAAYFD